MKWPKLIHAVTHTHKQFTRTKKNNNFKPEKKIEIYTMKLEKLPAVLMNGKAIHIHND